MAKRDDSRLVLFWLGMVVIAACCLIYSMLTFYDPEALDDPYNDGSFYIETWTAGGR